MDTFGRLPTDIISIINEFNQLPIIDVVYKNEHIYKLTIQFKYAFYEVHLLSHLINVNDVNLLGNDVIELYQFIQHLKMKQPYTYIRDFSDWSAKDKIKITYDGTIIIKSALARIVLPADCLDLFINVMEKYYNMLQTYPKYDY